MHQYVQRQVMKHFDAATPRRLPATSPSSATCSSVAAASTGPFRENDVRELAKHRRVRHAAYARPPNDAA
jgi:hypothetical protein